MATMKETVYVGRDNTVDIQLLSEGVPVALTSITRVVLKDVACVTDIDSDISPEVFDWSVGNGKIILSLGHEVMPETSYSFYVIVYDGTNTEGIVWDKISLSFKSICAEV